MPTRIEAFTEDEMVRKLNEARERAGSMTALAEEFDMNDQFLGRVAQGRDPVSPKIAERLGFERLTVFVKRVK